MVPQGLVADFSFDIAQWATPTSVEFADDSIGTIPAVAWHWNFWDGNESIEQNPTHIYQKVGTYQATLFISNDVEESTCTHEVEITETPEHHENDGIIEEGRRGGQSYPPLVWEGQVENPKYIDYAEDGPRTDHVDQYAFPQQPN